MEERNGWGRMGGKVTPGCGDLSSSGATNEGNGEILADSFAPHPGGRT
jgi:hypothetical protein